MSLALALRFEPARAQAARRVGVLANPPQVAIIEDALSGYGWVAGRNVDIVSKGMADFEQARTFIEELVRLPVDLLVIFTDAAAAVAVEVTRSVPIVMITTGAVPCTASSAAQ